MILVFLFLTQSFSGSNMVSYYTVTIFQVNTQKHTLSHTQIHTQTQTHTHKLTTHKYTSYHNIKIHANTLKSQMP